VCADAHLFYCIFLETPFSFYRAKDHQVLQDVCLFSKKSKVKSSKKLLLMFCKVGMCLLTHPLDTILPCVSSEAYRLFIYRNSWLGKGISFGIYRPSVLRFHKSNPIWVRHVHSLVCVFPSSTNVEACF
jgi:hypothetical protein